MDIIVIYITGSNYNLVVTEHIVIDLCLIECIVTSPVEAVAKYCDEYVCLCVCLSARISPEPHVQSLPNFL